MMALATGPAAASHAQVDAALGLTMTLLMIAFVIWVVGSMFSYHKYDSGGPKGGPIQKD